jgi:prolyl oligopeptidase
LKDKYAWLEDATNPRVIEWARRQDRIARESVKEYSDDLFKRLVPFYRRPIMRSVQLTKAGVFLFFSNDRSYRVELLQPDGHRELVADSARLGKDAVIQAAQARNDGRVVALHYSQGGSDEGTVAVMDLDTHKVVDRLQGFVGNLLWMKEDSYYYVRTYRNEKTPDGVEPPADRVLLRQGGKDEVVFGAGQQTNTSVGMVASGDGSEALLDVSYGWSKSRPYGGRIRLPESWAPLYKETDSIVTNINRVGGRHLLLSFEKGCGEVLSTGSGGVRKLVPEGNWPLQEAALVGDKLLCHYLVNACSELRLCDLNGRPKRTIKFPIPGSLIASPTGSAISALGGDAVLAFSSFALPFVVYKTKGSRLEKLLSEELPGRYSVRHKHATSADDTRVHYFVTTKNGSSTKKALLFGYGGFRVSLTPSFNPAFLPLMEDGAMFAVANLRGGLERGEEWHKAGMRERKPNVFDDYLAVLAKLNRQGMDVVGFGRSNGGLLMGATVNARPDLFAGVLIGYPVLDMMTFNRLLVGRAWVPEYGDPDDPKDRKFLLAYSPYHNIAPGKRYPPVFIYTGLKDDRVHPAHAFKFYARLKEVGADVLLRVETESGHIGTTPKARIREEADKLAFVYNALGIGESGKKEAAD